MNISDKKSYHYKDVVLLPRINTVKSRKEIPIEGWRIIASPMSCIVGEEFIKAVQKLDKNIRPIVCIPRQLDQVERLRLIRLSKELELFPFVAVGVEDSFAVLQLSKDYGFPILVDTANGYLSTVLDWVDYVKSYWKPPSLMAGNVVTRDGAVLLQGCGATHVRIGIGNGSACSTKFAAGFHRGQVTAVYSAASQTPGLYIVGDGGIEYPGDAVKAFGAGAHCVMIGRLFADCAEAENRATGENAYWGQASGREKSEYVEGMYTKLGAVPSGTLEDLLHYLWEGIQSGISYSGYRSVGEFIGNGVFEVKGR
jgi:IMP dehydrogenase